MPVKKNRTQSKCRDWERERRSRLCAAFTQLASLLPSTPPTSTKILILQHSIKYIQELQQIHAPLKKFDNALSVQENSECGLREELSLLQKRCSQLIGQLQRAGLTADENVFATINTTGTNVTTVISNKTQKGDIDPSDLRKTDPQKIVCNNNTLDVKKKTDSNLDVSKNQSNGESTAQRTKKVTKKQNCKIKKKIKRNVHITKKKITKRKLQAAVGQTSCLIVSGDTISGVARPISLALKNNQNNNVWVTSNNLGVVGNGLLPLLPLNAPLLIPPAQQQQTIYLLQRPIVKDSGLLNLNVAESSKQPSAFTVNAAPFLNSSAAVGDQQKRVHKIYSNFYGFDITKTTMVNKVPIPAFSSTLSMNRGKTADKNMKPMRVTQRSRSKLLNSLNASKKAQASSNSLRKNKENVQKAETIKPKETDPASNVAANSVNAKQALKDSASGVKSIQVANNTKPNEKNCENKLSTTTVTTATPVHNVNNIDECNVILRRHDEIIENSSKQKDGIENSINEPPATVNKTANESLNSYEMVKKCEPQTLSNVNLSDDSLFPLNNRASQCLLNSEIVKVHQFPKESIHKINHNDNGESLYTKSRNIPIDKMDNHTTTILDISKNTVSNKSDVKKRKCENGAVHSAINPFSTVAGRNIDNTDCRIESSKVAQLDDRSLGPAEIAEDLLASFGGVSEQAEMPPSPLASSPMAASPTAAFLLAFPLVCPGPRPDTPLNDNLQTPNICSLDNFSTFFTHKESTNGGNNIFPDYHPKIPNVQISGEKSKGNWPFGDHNKQNYNNLMPYGEVFDSNKYSVKAVDNFKLTDKNYHVKPPPVTTSSACAYSDTQTLFSNSKSINANSFYSLPESIFTYEHTPVMNNAKIDTKNSSVNNNSKNQFYFENIANQSALKNKLPPVNDNSLFTSMASSYMESMPSSNSTGNLNKINTYAPPAINETNSCRKHQGSENSMKIILPGVIPEYSPVSKSIDAPFTFASQVKSSIYPSSANIYTSCNTYNPFSSDFPSNSSNIGLACGNPVESVRTKPSAACFLDFNTPNVYSQNMNTWTDDSATIQTKKPDAPMILNQNSHISTELQPDFRFTLPLISKCANKTSNIPADLKNVKNSSNKVNNRDIKYNTALDSKNIKPEFSVQKGPVNWMTSEAVSSQNGNEMFMVTPPCGDFASGMPGISSSLACKKGDVYDQPFYHMPPGNYAPQVIGDDNQFTWSPSKLPPLGDGVSLAPCSLPTLVGDLALGIGADPKLSYPGTLIENDSAGKDRKNMSIKAKDGYAKNSLNQNIELNNSNATGNFLSVSQLMERGKAATNLSDNIMQCKSNVQYNQKKSSALDHARQYNIHTNATNKTFDANNSLPLFPLDVISNQQHNQLILPMQQKENNFNVKTETSNKSVNKNNYSTEALLQNNHTQYQSNRKQRHSSTLQKAYHDVGNAPISTSLTGNQHIPLQFDNYPQTQQYTGNAFPYGSQAASGMNSSFYSSSNFITAPATMVTSNYMNAGFTPDMADFSNNTNENIFYVPKLESCKSKTLNELPSLDIPKYSFNNKSFNQSKDPPVKHRQDPNFKKDTSSNAKRPKKQKNSYTDTYSHYGATSNTVNSPMGMDDSFFGYFSSSQMHPYPSQPPVLPAIQPVGQNNQKIISATGKPIMTTGSAMSASPNPTGTSLTNFNLSTIFPEINKRTTMPSFHDAQQTISKPPCPILFQ